MERSTKLVEQYTEKLLQVFPALRYRNFKLFWFGQLISLIGTWMQTTGQSWLILRLTRNDLALGVVGALQFLPVLLFTLFGGVLADRLPKRRLLLCTQSCATLLAFILWLLVATQRVQIWHVYLLAFLLGLNSAFDMPTRQAFVVEMVGRASLANAVALNSLVFNMARIVGPGVAGLVIARFGEGPLFLGNALSYLPVLLGLSMIDAETLFLSTHKGPRRPEGTFASLGQGLRYVRQTPAIFLIVAVASVFSLFGINFTVIEPLIATELLHQGALGFGFISSSFGLGALIAALLIAWGNKRPSLKKMLASAICFCLALGLLGLSRWSFVSMSLAVVVGFTMITFTATANTALQTLTPDHLRGRVMSVYLLVFNGSTPLGNLFTGWLASLVGISLTLIVNASASLLAAVVGWLKRGRAEGDLRRTLR